MEEYMKASASAAKHQHKEHAAVVSLIAPYLDSHSIHNYLRAFPTLQKSAVLITDHAMPPLYYGDLVLVERRSFESHQVERPERRSNHHTFYQEDTWDRLKKPTFPVYDKAVDTQAIKLVEVTLMATFSGMMRQEHGMSSCCRFQDLDPDSTTFFFFGLPPYDTRSFTDHLMWMENCSDLQRKLDEFTESKWIVGTRTFFGEKQEQAPLYHSAKSIARHDGVAPGAVSWDWTMLSKLPLSQLETLRIEGIVDLPDFLDLPTVTDLSLVFSRSPHRARVHGLWAPNVRRCVVHFSTGVPDFSECTIGNLYRRPEEVLTSDLYRRPEEILSRLRRQREDAIGYSFELANVAFLDRSSQMCHSIPPLETGSLELPFLLNFNILVLGATVPLGSINRLWLANIIVMYWSIFSQDDVSSVDDDYLPSIPWLWVLWIHVSGSGVELPELCRDREEFGLLVVCSLGLDNRIGKLLRNPVYFRSLVVYSSTRLLARARANPSLLDRLPQITDEEWAVFASANGSYCELTLSGIEFNYTAGNLKANYLNLRPLYRNKPNEPFNIQVNGVQMHASVRTWTFVPLLMYDVEDVSVHFVQPITRPSPSDYSWGGRCVLGVSSNISKVSVGGVELHKEVTEEWKDEMKKLSGRQYHKRTHVDAHRWEIPTADNERRKLTLEERQALNTTLYNPVVRFPRDERSYTVMLPFPAERYAL